jgi:hypothetical protein
MNLMLTEMLLTESNPGCTHSNISLTTAPISNWQNQQQWQGQSQTYYTPQEQDAPLPEHVATQGYDIQARRNSHVFL